MKQRKCKQYLILSSAHLGVSEDIIKVYAQVAKFYRAEVYHLGATISEKDAKSVIKCQRAAVTLTSEIDMLAGRKKSERRVALLEARLETVEAVEQSIVHDERSKISSLVDRFGKINLVLAPGLHTPEIRTMKGVTAIDEALMLSKYMSLSAVQPSGDRTVSRPVTTNAKGVYKRTGKTSWISAHPVPSIETTSKPGLNEAHKYYTVGALKHVSMPQHSRDFHRIAHMPCAIMVLIDENGEYHAKQLYIDYEPMRGNYRPIVLDDGMVFSGEGMREVGSDDKATYSTDDHAPHQHAGTLASLRMLNTLHKPGTLINGGDAADFTSVCRHTKNVPGAREGLRLCDDLAALRRLLDAQANVSSIKRKILIDSNHHEWPAIFVDENPSLKGTFDWDTLSRTHYPDWTVMTRDSGENVIYMFGDYVIRHGDQENLREGEGMSPQGKYMCGHHHRYNVYRRAVMVGCGAGLGPAYVANRVTSWISQVTSLTKYKGVAAVNPKIVLHDHKNRISRFAYRDRVYEVDFYDLHKVA